MDRKEATEFLREKYSECKEFYDLSAHPGDDYPHVTKYMEALNMALYALSEPNEPITPCDLCAFSPPSSGDEKPCSICPATRRSLEEDDNG